MEVIEGISEAIALAIMEGAKAGVFRAAARLNPKTAATWETFADGHTERVRALLDEALSGLGAEDAHPAARGEEW